MKKLYIAIPILLLPIVTLDAHALLPPEMIVAAGTQIIHVMGISFALLSTFFISFIEIFKNIFSTSGKKWKWWYYLIIILILLAISYLIAIVLI